MVMGPVEEAVMVTLVDASPSVVVVCGELARRLDAGPGDDAAVRLARELRQWLASVPQSGGDDLDRLLAEIRDASD